MTHPRRTVLRHAGYGTVGGALLAALTSVFPEFASARAQTRGPAQGVSAVDDCSDPRRCEARCKCNGYQIGKCQTINGQAKACWCSNDNQRWSTAPSTCP